jgi:hypothetical protein
LSGLNKSKGKNMKGLMLVILVSLLGAMPALASVKTGGCGAGYMMIGIHVDNNEYKCLKTSRQDAIEWDKAGKTQREKMHACPSGWYATDYKDTQNDLRCGYGPLIDVNSEEKRNCNNGQNQVSGGKDGSMCGCQNKNGNLWLVTGYHKDKNEVLCTPMEL